MILIVASLTQEQIRMILISTAYAASLLAGVGGGRWLVV
jgi:hypothetical protein